ncbi:hypothetical protein EQZ23_02275 [Sphingomonas sp. UV9]|uniref:hypothetical protein n=1 Tax=Sphingomonas sp. UV9 TaxID=1851410 RepID=UPI000FFBC7C1|nr:hypothetical protein [Sphingomonas sp. UV9]RXD06944.1 hypothetical protein EQZ23_02275 [Sphingomonas sp. UV9]
MPHAKVHHDEDDARKTDAKTTTKAAGEWVDEATDAAKAKFATATDAVKAHPKTAIAVGATVIAGIAAAIAAPALRAKDDDKKTPAKKKSAPKTPAKPKGGKSA